MLKVALCFYGQPRLYEQGRENLVNFLNNSKNCEFDIFFNTWEVDKDQKEYASSPYRFIDKEELTIEENIIEKLIHIFQPKNFSTQHNIDFDYSNLENTLIYKNTLKKLETKKIKNLNNLMSHLYTKQKVCDLLTSTSNTEGLIYDMVVATRFDFRNKIMKDINSFNKNFLNIPNIKKRKIFNSDLVITSMDIFKNYFNILNNLKNISDSEKLNLKMKKLKEEYYFNIEELQTINYLYYYENLKKVNPSDKLPHYISNPIFNKKEIN